MRKIMLAAAIALAPVAAYADSPTSWLSMTDQQAARFRTETANDLVRLEPRKGVAGTCAGKNLLSTRVLYDAAQISHRDALLMLTEVQCDINTTWPPEPDLDAEAVH